jgi:transcriptional regulator with XRE-family HTH domain
MAISSQRFLASTRRSVAKRVRELRLGRNWKQTELAKHLGLSQNRLSEIERGEGSFTAEQLLLIMKLFNVPPSHFARDARDPTAEVQNTLARLGAAHLYEADALPSVRLTEAGSAIREALTIAAPRLVTAIAPVLIRNADQLNLAKIHADLAALGFERRLPWVVENTLEAVRIRYLDGVEATNVARETARLQLFLDFVKAPTDIERVDIVDPDVRTSKSVAQLERDASAISKRWGIVSTLKPDDFAAALEHLD